MRHDAAGSLRLTPGDNSILKTSLRAGRLRATMGNHGSTGRACPNAERGCDWQVFAWSEAGDVGRPGAMPPVTLEVTSSPRGFRADRAGCDPATSELPDLQRDRCRQCLVFLRIHLRDVSLGVTEGDLCGVQAELLSDSCGEPVP